MTELQEEMRELQEEKRISIAYTIYIQEKYKWAIYIQDCLEYLFCCKNI